MPLITANAKVLYETGTAEKLVVYQVHTVDTGDTIDVASKFSKVTGAVSLGSGGASPKADVCATAGTIVTLDAATQSDDTLFVAVIGAAA